MLEGERSGRIVRRGARSLLNLPNTASPIPRLPFLLSSSREKLGGFVLRRKTSSFQPARMSFTTCLRTVHIPRPFCGSSTICDVTRHNFDRWFFPFSPRINPFLSSFQVLRHGYYFRDYCTKESELTTHTCLLFPEIFQHEKRPLLRRVKYYGAFMGVFAFKNIPNCCTKL